MRILSLGSSTRFLQFATVIFCLVLGVAGAEAQKGGSRSPAPTGLSAMVDVGQVRLSWTGSTGATSYRVKRSTVSGKSYTTLVNPVTTRFHDSTAAVGTRYYYVVTALNASGESSNSSQVTATVLAAASVDRAIAYTSNGLLKAMNSFGQCQAFLTNYLVGRAAFSPSGLRIAFLAGSGAPQGPGLYVMNLDGTGLYRVRPINHFFALNASVDWGLMPDGIERIAYTDVLPGDADYSVLLTDTTGSEWRLVGSGATDACVSPSFSGDGATIAYATVDGEGAFFCGDAVSVQYAASAGQLVEVGRQSHIYGVAGSPFFAESLADPNNPWLIDNVSVSPTGDRLIVEASRLQTLISDLFMIDITDPALRTRLTNSPDVNDEYPSWSPDGSQVVFQTLFRGYSNIVTMPAGGGLGTTLCAGSQPSWRRQP